MADEATFLNDADWGGLRYLTFADDEVTVPGGPGGDPAITGFALPFSGTYTVALGGFQEGTQERAMLATAIPSHTGTRRLVAASLTASDMHRAMLQGDALAFVVPLPHRSLAPCLELAQGRQQVGRAAAPARQLRHQHRVDLVPLRERHHLPPLGPVVPHPRRGLLVDLDHLVASAPGKRGQVSLLPRAGLVGGRDPAVEGGALSQLNPSRMAARKPLFRLCPAP